MGDPAAEPTDDAVRAAVEATGDAQLTALLGRPGSYVLRPLDLPAEHLAFFAVVAVDVPHAMGVTLAFDPGSGEASVTSHQPDAVQRVLAAEPALSAPELVWELVREPSTPQRLVGSGVDERGDLHRYEFRVDDGRGTPVTWQLSLAPGASRWEQVG